MLHVSMKNYLISVTEFHAFLDMVLVYVECSSRHPILSSHQIEWSMLGCAKVLFLGGGLLFPIDSFQH